MEIDQFQTPSGNSDWRLNHLVLEAIFKNLDPTDLKSCSFVSKFWLSSTSKAFKQKFRPFVQVPGPEDEPVLRRALLQRFQRFQDLKFKLSRSSIRLDSILGFLNGALMTRLSFHYEPTAEVVLGINRFLLRLTTGFPALEQLEVCPEYNGNYPDEELTVKWNEDVEVDESVHQNLKVLRVPTGPNSGSGIDWRFLKPLQKLGELHLLAFDVRGPNIVQRQLSDFQKHFPPSVNIAKLVVHPQLLGVTSVDPTQRPEPLTHSEIALLYSILRTIKPEACIINFENVNKELLRYDLQWLYIDQQIDQLLQALTSTSKVAKLTFYTHVTLEDWIEKRNLILDRLLSPLTHYNKNPQKGHILLRIDLATDATPSSFVEIECGHFGAPLVLRYGPISPEHGSWFETFHDFIAFWEWPFYHLFDHPYYTNKRKYIFGLNQGNVLQQQWYAAQQWPILYSIDYDEQVEEIERQVRNGVAVVPAHQCGNKWLWKPTEFSDPLDATVNVTAKSSFDHQIVSELFVYSID